jgi:hypothetical protein
MAWPVEDAVRGVIDERAGCQGAVCGRRAGGAWWSLYT